jgi:hypothetical protein
MRSVCSALTIAAAVTATPASAIMIDQFDGEQTLPPASTFVGPGIIGGERDFFSLGTLGENAQVEIDVQASGALRISATSATILVGWDGPNLPPNEGSEGLGGIDLTQGGAHDAFAIRVLASSAPMWDINIGVYDTASPLAFAFLNLAGPVLSPQTFYVPFASFDPIVDFTDIDGIGLFSFSVSSHELQIDWIATAAIPEPPSVMLALLACLGLAASRKYLGHLR